MKNKKKLVVGTRFWGENSRDFGRVKEFCSAIQPLVDWVFVAVNKEADTSRALDFKISHAELFPVTPWGKFVVSLNALVVKAVSRKADLLLLMSVETRIDSEQLSQLLREMHDDTLVVGAALEGHFLHSSRRAIRAGGREVPWNTFALWNLSLISRLGFPLIGDALFNPKAAGVEEVATISVYQKMYGAEHAKAKLISVPGIRWNVSHFNVERMKRHKEKMKSKEERAALQLKWAKLPRPFVWHIK